MVIAVPLLLLGGCFAVVVSAAGNGADQVQKAISDLTPAPMRQKETKAAAHAVVFQAEGHDGATKAGNVTYSIAFQIKQQAAVPLPYSKTVKVADTDSSLSLWVQNGDAEGSVTCRIKVDGKTIREDTIEGPYRVCRVQANSLNETPQAVKEPTRAEPTAKAEQPTAKATSEEVVALPNVVGMNLQKAQDTMQASGFYFLDDQDDTGRHRLQIYDRNWVVTRQEPTAGRKVPVDTKVVLWAKKYGE
ncbi:PASTA domain-containing protein [Planotetraspora sp. GP83]|uniref:PASTA domain-containing protein n=1 Tax=Planotetraspora sp. GP83 TaxID=3156264 RepID=UPI003514411F